MKTQLMLLLLSLLTLAAAYPQTSTSEAGKLTKLLEDYDEAYLRQFTYLAAVRGDNRYNDQLVIDTESYRAKTKELYTTFLQQLSQVDKAKLQGQDLLNYQIIDFTLKNNLEGTGFDSYLLPIDQRNSFPAFFARLGSGKTFYPFKKVKDYEDFLKQISAFQVWSDTAIANMQKGIVKGVVQPKALMEKVLPQLEAMLVKDITQSIFYGPVAHMPPDFGEADKSHLQQAYSKAIAEEVIPSYRKLYDFIKNDYLPHCRTTYGLSALPGGKERYAHLAQSFSTTSLTPDQIFDIGMGEVKRIRGEMEKVKKQVGFKGNLEAFFQYLDTAPQFYPFNTGEEVLQAYRDIHARMLPQLKQTFNLVPKTPFEIREVEKFLAATSSAHYLWPAADGSRPGIFYVPIVDAKRYNNYTMENTFLHEAIPGHHYQIALQQEQQHLPNLRKFGNYNAFIEGWGLYTESLGKELGLYQDPYQYMGRLAWDMHRALRLVVDAGIHDRGWTREQAIAFSRQNEPMSEQGIIAEVERYMANPGQALSYKIGELKMKELRSKAEKALGKKFDVRAFHDEILRNGAMPLAVLEVKMNAWIKNQQTF
jgi:uncharacterized protein (DUF885 family)